MARRPVVQTASGRAFISLVPRVCGCALAFVAAPADRRAADSGSLRVCGGFYLLENRDVPQINDHAFCFTREPVSRQTRFLYAGSDSGVVQSPTAFCGRYRSCSDCVLARDPYCAWDPRAAACVRIMDAPGQVQRCFYTPSHTSMEAVLLNSGL